MLNLQFAEGGAREAAQRRVSAANGEIQMTFRLGLSAGEGV